MATSSSAEFPRRAGRAGRAGRAAAGAFFAAPQPTLRGDGLVVRPWRMTDADAAAVVRAYADPAIARWHVASVTAAQAPGWIEARGTRWSGRTGADWAVAAVDGGVVLGRIGLHHLHPGEGWAQVAYWVLPEARGQRVAVRALALLGEWAFDTAGLHRLELEHSVLNDASCRVATRAGFAAEGVRRSAQRHADGWHDMHTHARVAGDPPAAGR